VDRDFPSSDHSDLVNVSPSKADPGLHHEIIAKDSPLSIMDQSASLCQELKINTNDSPKFKPDFSHVFSDN
jgi:hypothetical protein